MQDLTKKTLKRFRITVKGKVQGVCFRMYTEKEANKLGLKGFVKNLSDTSLIEIVVEGDSDNIDQLIKWAHKGPPYAHIKDIVFKEETYLGEFSSFSIKYYDF